MVNLPGPDRAHSVAHWQLYLTDLLHGEHTAVLVREPLQDCYCPSTGDLDVIVFHDHHELLPERLVPNADYPPVDLIRLPRRALTDLPNLALQGVIPHRLLSSRLVRDPDGSVAPKLAQLRELMYRIDLQQQRISALLDLGYHAVREIGVTRDVPALALFWLHIAFASLLAAIGDACGKLCPNVYTRPFDYVDALETTTGIEFGEAASRLRLDDDLTELSDVLWQLHAIVTTRFPEPVWPAKMRLCTRYEYRYFAAKEEVSWRIAAATELSTHLNRQAAVFYLRFMAYMLACIPIVHHRALEGIDVSFVRPQRAVGPDLEKHAPDVLPLLGRALGGSTTLSEADLDGALRWVKRLKRHVDQELTRRELQSEQSIEWEPYQSRG